MVDEGRHLVAATMETRQQHPLGVPEGWVTATQRECRHHARLGGAAARLAELACATHSSPCAEPSPRDRQTSMQLVAAATAAMAHKGVVVLMVEGLRHCLPPPGHRLLAARVGALVAIAKVRAAGSSVLAQDQAAAARGVPLMGRIPRKSTRRGRGIAG